MKRMWVALVAGLALLVLIATFGPWNRGPESASRPALIGIVGVDAPGRVVQPEPGAASVEPGPSVAPWAVPTPATEPEPQPLVPTGSLSVTLASSCRPVLSWLVDVSGEAGTRRLEADDGPLLFTDLAPGDYVVRLGNRGWSEAQRTLSVAAGTTSAVELVAEPANRVTGLVVEAASGSPLTSFRVDIETRRLLGGGIPEHWFTRSLLVTSPDGSFCAAGFDFPEGTSGARISAIAEGFHPARTEWLPPSTPPAFWDGLTLELQRGSTLSGRIVDLASWEPVVGASVVLDVAEALGTDSPGAEEDDLLEGEPRPTRQTAETDAAGEFLIPVPGTGSMRVLVRHVRYLPALSEPIAVPTDGYVPPPLEIALQRGSSIHGHVVGAPEDTSEILVELALELPSSPGAPTTLERSGMPSVDGRFAFPSLWAGRYVLTAYGRPEGSSFLAQVARRSVDLAPGESLEVLLEVDQAPPTGVTVHGRCLLDPARDAGIVMAGLLGEDGTIVGMATAVGADGAFAIAGVPAGTYVVTVRAETESRRWSGLTAAPVVVAAGRDPPTVEVDLTRPVVQVRSSGDRQLKLAGTTGLPAIDAILLSGEVQLSLGPRNDRSCVLLGLPEGGYRLLAAGVVVAEFETGPGQPLEQMVELE